MPMGRVHCLVASLWSVPAAGTGFTLTAEDVAWMHIIFWMHIMISSAAVLASTAARALQFARN